ncbi:MAG: S-layer homology domain-containing protein, partial [Oscillospiraceae bacterium]|nr:S-layer homology domain-containing protein [Oscillospiraceae bacterium]
MMKKLCLLLAAVFAAGMMMACNAQVLSADTTPAAAETDAAPSAMPFADVPSDAYYADAVRYCWETGLMAGTSASTFSPDGTTTRAQVVTILWRLADEPAGGVSGFADVPAAAYYAEAAAWAEQAGVRTGQDDGRFAPEGAMSRGQLGGGRWGGAGAP